MSFEHALDVVLQNEGGYVLNPADRGGATNKGITQAVYDHWRSIHSVPIRDVHEITDIEVAGIYRTQYWQPAGCEKLSSQLALVHFDAAVNHGVKKAIQFLQRAVEVDDDGIFGRQTLAAVNADLSIQGEPALVYAYLAERSDFYDAIVRNNKSQSVFLAGWKNRIAKLKSLTGVA